MSQHKILDLVTYEEYKSCISQNQKVVIDFYATWCGPCNKVAPKFADFSGIFSNIVFAKVNVDINSQATETAEVEAMPTFVLYKDGKILSRHLGTNTAALEAKLKALDEQL